MCGCFGNSLVVGFKRRGSNLKRDEPLASPYIDRRFRLRKRAVLRMALGAFLAEAWYGLVAPRHTIQCRQLFGFGGVPEK